MNLCLACLGNVVGKQISVVAFHIVESSIVVGLATLLTRRTENPVKRLSLHYNIYGWFLQLQQRLENNESYA